MKYVLLILLFVFVYNLTAQQTKEWLDNLENPEFYLYELQKEDVKSKYVNYD